MPNTVVSVLASTCLIVLSICGSLNLHAQPNPIIEGRVTSSSGLALEGISVAALPGGQSTQTDATGSFRLVAYSVAKQGVTLEFSGIGYRNYRLMLGPEQVGKPLPSVVLQADVLKLDEVVVNGAASRVPRRELGNAITTISTKELNQAATSHLSAYMNGRIMGGVVMQNAGDPAGGFSLKLRGVGSVFGSSEPLYMVDGVIVDNSSQNMVNLNLSPTSRYQTGTNRLVDINPHDIDRIEVVNGPAAATIYGSRAANGVVQIFTKQGRKGGMEIVFTSSVNHNSLANRIALNTYPFRFGIPQVPRLDTVGDNRTMLFNNRPDKGTVPGHGPTSYTGRLDTTRYPVKRYDYQDDIFSPAWGTDQHISLAGGGDKGTYYMSGSYLDNGGILEGTSFRRYGMKLGSSFQLNKWARISGGLSYANSLSDEMPNSILQFSPIGAMNHTDNVYDVRERDLLGNLRKVEHGWVNPLSPVETYDLSVETNRTIANLAFSLAPLKEVQVSATFGLDTYGQEGSAYQARIPYPSVPLGQFSDGYVSATRLNYRQWTSDVSASYKAGIGKDFSTATVAGFTGQYIRTSYQAQEGRDLVPFVEGIRAAQNFFSLPVDQRSEQTIWGYFLQETIGYKNLLHLTLAGRFDGSSAFGASAGTIFYPKAGLAFTASELVSWKEGRISRWFNTLHLRAAYGKAGNLTGIGPYDRFTVLPPIVYYNNVVGYVPQNRRGNEAIRPEVKTEIEIGADMAFMGGRLFGRVTLYQQELNDMVVPFNIPPSNGYPSLLDNLGKMENKGFEFLVGGSPVKTKDFNWELSLLFNKNRNSVTNLYQDANFVGFESNQGVVEGHPVGVYYGTFYARNPDGSLLLKNVDGYLLPQVERGDPVKNLPARDNNGQPTGTPISKVLGDPNPDYTATLVNEFRYEQFSLRIQMDRVAGFEMFNWTRIIRNNIGNGKMAEKEIRGELTRGWVGAVGGQITGPFIQEEAVEDATFTKIREVSLGYTLMPKKYVKKLELILAGRNLYTFTKYEGYDPETSTAGQSLVRGTDYGSYPIPRVIQFSIITTF